MSMPKHLGVIMDGNRRFAKRLLKEPWRGHEWGADKLKELLGWCNDVGISEVTVYAFSIQNFNRPKKEFDYLMKLASSTIDKMINDKEQEINKHKIRVRIIGRINLLPKELQNKIIKLQDKTKNNDGYALNIAFAYGGREEIVDAVKKIALKVQNKELDPDSITDEVIKDELYLKSEPDLIIRTGGEMRLSNFLTYQSVYSELVFVDSLWPEFSKDEFIRCIDEFSSRKRRFGR